MRTVAAVWLAVSMALAPAATSSIWPTTQVWAQDPTELPALGDTILTDQLTTPGTFESGSCRTGLINGEFAPHGFQTRVTGVCTEDDQSVGVGLTTQGLSFEDGDMVVDVQINEGYDRAVLGLHARRKEAEFGLSLTWAPALRRIAVRDRPTGPVTVAAEGQSVPEVAPGAWTQLALRVRGDRVWVLMNDQLVLTATHTATARGGAGLYAGRFGDPKDDYPVSILWRSMRVSALVDGDSARAPTYAKPDRQQTPSAAAPRSGPNLDVLGPPPKPGAVIHEESMTERGLLQSFPCTSGRNRSEVTADGYRLTVSGRCDDARPSANLLAGLNGLTLPDGELRFEFKVTSGLDRIVFTMLSRSQASSNGGSYAVRYAPGVGDLTLSATQSPNGLVPLASRRDLQGKIGQDEWHSIAIRHHGPRHWLLIDDAPMLATEDTSTDTGLVIIAVARFGTPDDDPEVGMTFRSLRVSRIEGAPDDRAPTVRRPSERPSRPGGNLSQLSDLLWTKQMAPFR